MNLRMVFAFLAIIGIINSSSSGKIKLVENHEAAAVIVVPEGTLSLVGLPLPTDSCSYLQKRTKPLSELEISQGVHGSEWYSATANSISVGTAELQKYIQKSTGAKLAIKTENSLTESDLSKTKIFVGNCKATKAIIDIEKISPEGFVIQSCEDDLYIVGKDKTPQGLAADGTLNGCYEFLQKYMGIRWIMPGDLGEIVPKASSLNINEVSLKIEPLLWQRRIRDCHSHLEYGRICDYLKQWNLSQSQWDEYFDPQITYPWFRRHRLGARVKLKYMHSNVGWWDRFHDTNPNIFAMQPNGSRINTGVREQLCVSNPETWKVVAEEKIKELKADPLLTAASITPNDGGKDNTVCCCDGCATWDAPGTPKLQANNGLLSDETFRGGEIPLSDRYFHFYNEVCTLVGKQLPGSYLAAYAYGNYKYPPVTVTQLADNLIVGYVGFNKYSLEKERQADKETWLAWSKLAKQLFIRPNLFWYNMGFPANYTHKIAQDIRFMADNKMRAADFDGLIGNWGSDGLNYYVTAELLWNPYADVNSIINDYCKSAYGKGAPEMRAYHDRVETLTNTIASDGKYTDLKVNLYELAGYYNDSVINELQSHLDKAMAAIGERNSDDAKRVQLAADTVELARRAKILAIGAYDVRKGRSTLKDFEPIKQDFIEYYKAHVFSWSFNAAHNWTYLGNALRMKD